ncbi:MAG: NosD domain-containing protein [Candidatus Hodarchaeota archaeon]
MTLNRGRMSQKLILTGRVLLLTVSLSLVVPTIMAASIRTPLIPIIQASTMVEISENNYHDGGKNVWDRTYGGSERDGGRSVEQTADGGYIILGWTESYGVGGRDLWVIKTDIDGNVEWDKTYGGKKFETGRSVEQTTDGGYIIGGATFSYGAGGEEVWVIKTDADGNIIWEKTYGGPDEDACRSVKQTADGGYIIAGARMTPGAGPFDVWVIKIDATGTVVWEKTYGGPADDGSRSIEQTADGGYIIAGTTKSYGAGDKDVWVIKIDATGTVIWDKTYGGPESEMGRIIEQTADGGYIIAGTTMSYGAGSIDVWMIKIDATGNTIWTQTYGGPEKEDCGRVEQTVDGGYIIAAYTTSYGAGKEDFWVIQTDFNGNVVWNQTYGGPERDGDGGVWGEQTMDGGYIITGGTWSSGAGEEDVWLIKVSKPIYIYSDFGLDKDLNFCGDGFIVMADDITLDLNGHTLTGSGMAETYGVVVKDRTGVTIKNGIIENFTSGIFMKDATGNILTGNTVTENIEYGIYLSGSNGNTIYNNYFVNKNNAYDEGGTNAWNFTKTPGTNIIGGVYLGGNYFSDYLDVDTDGDGIGDTPYEIPGGNNRDYLPLVEYKPTETTPETTPETTIPPVGSFPIPRGSIGVLLATLLLVMRRMRRGKRKAMK